MDADGSRAPAAMERPTQLSRAAPTLYKKWVFRQFPGSILVRVSGGNPAACGAWGLTS